MHNKGFLPALLCSNNNFNPGYNRKMLIGKVYPCLTKFISFLNSCFVQCNAPLGKYVNVAQHLQLFKKYCVFIIFSSISGSLSSMWFRKRYTTNFNSSVSVWLFTRTFLLPMYMVLFRQQMPVLGLVSAKIGQLPPLYSSEGTFSGRIFRFCIYTMIKFQFWF